MTQLAAPSAVENPPSPRKRVRKGGSAPYLFLAPFIIVFIGFLIIPIILAVSSSLFAETSSGLGFDSDTQTLFVGVQNYITAITDADFVAGFGRVLLFGVVQVPVMLGLALLLALLFDSAVTRLKRVFQLAIFLPYAVPGVVAALLWGFLYQPGVSPIVKWLTDLGIPVDFLAPGTVLWSIANISTWSYVGVNMVVLFGALQAIPRDMFEAARIDGASELRTALQIKVPMIAPTLVLTCIFSIIGTLQLFNEPQVLRSITSNVSSSFTPNMAIFTAATDTGNLHVSSAMAILLGLVTLILSLIVSRSTNRKGGK